MGLMQAIEKHKDELKSYWDRVMDSQFQRDLQQRLEDGIVDGAISQPDKGDTSPEAERRRYWRGVLRSVVVQPQQAVESSANAYAGVLDKALFPSDPRNQKDGYGKRVGLGHTEDVIRFHLGDRDPELIKRLSNMDMEEAGGEAGTLSQIAGYAGGPKIAERLPATASRGFGLDALRRRESGLSPRQVDADIDWQSRNGGNANSHGATMEVAKKIAKRAQDLKPHFDDFVDRIAHQFGGTVDHGPSKLAPRIAEKLIEAVRDSAPEIRDSIRSSIIVNDVARARAIAGDLKRQFPDARIKDTFDSPLATGYRDIKVWLPFEGTMGEVAIHIPEMYKAKKLTEPLYKRWRSSENPILRKRIELVHNEAWRSYKRRMGQ